MVLFKTKKLEVTEYGYLLETTTTATLNVWLSRCMVWIDKRTVYNILNA
jgi:predicted MarR family transcription regulator